jgi:ATP-dependent Clp protease ATP-binding subunit ClpA
MRLVAAAVLTALLPLAAVAQGDQPIPKRPDRPGATQPNEKIEDTSDQHPNLPEEMRIRMAIERAEGEHRKVLGDVEKLMKLAADVSSSYRDRSTLSSDDMKRLSNIEKLAKRILSHAGGNEVSNDSTEAERLSTPEAVEHLTAATCKIRDDMTSQTRHVVSASVIARSNEVITLAQLLRRRNKKD